MGSCASRSIEKFAVFPGSDHDPTTTDLDTGVHWTEGGPDRERWVSVRVPPPSGAPIRQIIVYAHGNACTANDMLDVLEGLAARGDALVICPEYPGYGLMRDATRPCMDRAVRHVRYALSEAKTMATDISPDVRVAAVGQSIGAALVAEALADFEHQRLVDRVCLISPFSSLRAITGHHAPSSITSCATSLIETDRFNTVELARWITTNGADPPPVRIIHGLDDEVIPIDHARKIHLANPERISLTEVDGTHNEFRVDLEALILGACS